MGGRSVEEPVQEPVESGPGRQCGHGSRAECLEGLTARRFGRAVDLDRHEHIAGNEGRLRAEGILGNPETRDVADLGADVLRAQTPPLHEVDDGLGAVAVGDLQERTFLTSQSDGVVHLPCVADAQDDEGSELALTRSVL